MSSQDPRMQDIAMSIPSSLVSTIDEKNDPSTKNAASPQGRRTNTVSRSAFSGTKVYERKSPLLSLFSRRKNVLEREQYFSRISRSVTEEATTKHTLETHTTEVPLTEDRKSFLLKFFQKIQAKFELETV